MSTNEQKTCECPKCDGKGKIEAFNHIENGGCFACGGSGRLTAILSERKGISDSAKIKITFLENCTQEKVGGMTYKQLMNAREFAATCGVDGVHELFNNKFGNAFQIAQNTMLQKYGS